VATEGKFAHLYVLGEVLEPDGFVKIGLNYGKPMRSGRNGLQSGNWRELSVLYRHYLPADALRWTEFVIHEHLQPWCKGGEWFDARRLLSARDAWGDLLDRSFRGEVPGGALVDRGTPGHQLLGIRMARWSPPKEVVAECGCGHKSYGLATTLPKVYRDFLKDHTHQRG